MAILIIPVCLLVCTMALTRLVPSHPRWRPFVIVLNVVVTLRYLLWRATETLNWDGGWGTVISLAAYGAELYGFLVVLHHYTIATRSVKRTSTPPDATFLPSVDVLVASYNEGADILTRTLVGCQAIDYPNKQIYLLDDGRRPEIADLCARLGVNYITRNDNKGAKAGNLNNALSQTRGDFIVTFDADHVPVSSFLTETLGYFREKGVAHVQTAHHFFNPDLFQDRLRSQAYIANEQDMFYHVVQPGRDVHNASFYCGSGAVFRRSAIEGIGGFPMTTITEDLHTSMLLHSSGWRSVYVDKNLSAGLAPESFDGYITQRRRWARGTMQVMLLRGGLTLPNLTIAQRIHYFATLWYWLYGIPRVIYLLSPLFFLLLGVRPLVVRNMTDLLLYYLPHLFISVTAFQLVNRGMRRIFWSDIYESCIAIQMAITAITFPWTGRKVHFAVTPKGTSAQAPAKRSSAWPGWPMLALALLIVVALIRGTAALTLGAADRDSTVINMFWAAYNLVVLGFGLLLLRHPAQQRVAPRVPRALACHLAGQGLSVDATSIDVSEAGASLRLQRPQPLPETFDLTITSPERRTVTVRARLVRSELRDGAIIAAVQFVDRTDEQHRRLIELMFCSPDSWKIETGLTMDTPQHVRRIVHSVLEIFSTRRALRRLAPRFQCDLPVTLVSPAGWGVMARAVDISDAGLGITVARDESLPEGTDATVTVSWNVYDRSTFRVKVVNARTERGQTLLGMTFVGLDAQQRKDLFKYLYARTESVVAERKAA